MKETFLVSAEVILKSKSGRSLASGDVAITSDNIEEFRPTQESIKKATQGLQKLGFTVSQGGVTLTIVGEQKLFEEVFKVKLTTKKVAGGIEVRANTEASIPHSLSDIVEQVVFIPPPELY